MENISNYTTLHVEFEIGGQFEKKKQKTRTKIIFMHFDIAIIPIVKLIQPAIPPNIDA